ncbi:carbamoyltransferase HypF [Kitasatospora sp. NPDC097643]|uniref:carbamoyltransferase HypF n=1 Tax=Kitasatospora sp. NPDC097643 TaxID=3157230 RepID=UPI00331F6410
MTTELRRVEVHGTVQGVGFRPFAHRLATSLGLSGWVRNEDGHVVSLVAGPPSALAEYTTRLGTDAPPLAVVTSVRSRPAPADEAPGPGFTVLASTVATTDLPREIPPDAATCPDCLCELFDPADRRYRYPFLNCTACGPRATIIDDLPYDRRRTAMRAFPLCPACADECEDPANRRFHAEPVACPVCGPHLKWDDGDVAGESALAAAEQALRAGRIVAVKGLGGYQLVCDAADEQTVQRLRDRKHRPAKPFAVMVPDLAAARRLAYVNQSEAALLTSTARPIVLLTARPGALAPAVHPGTDRVGLFLPYTPLHHLMMRDLDQALVVTSGNRSHEPIAIDDAEARRILGDVADGFLTHNRPIRARYDDSVTHAPLGTPAVLRRARGYAPAPLRLPRATPEPVVAVGAQLKHTFALAIGDRAVLGPHTGDLQDATTLDAFETSFHRLARLQAVEPAWVAHDLHPDYLSSAFATRWPRNRRIAVQHHHAHVASCAAEHGVTGPFVGVAYDGLGLGDDGTLWGGEILLADLTGYRRLGRFARAPLPGGEAAVRRPARMALGYLYGLERLGEPIEDAFSHRLDPREVRTVVRMIERGFNSPTASSAGRLFDAVSALLGLRDDASYEGEAAVALEQAAGSLSAEALPWRISRVKELSVYDPAPTLAAVLHRTAAGEPTGPIAAAFHTTLAEVTGALVAEAVRETGADTVCLSGGCFQNRRLLTEVHDHLTRQGLRVLANSAVPANDGGISYGQAAVAAARLSARKET